MTKRALSLAAGLSDTAVAQIEAGRVPLVDTVERVALALGVPACWLVYGALGERPFQKRVPREEQVHGMPQPTPRQVPATTMLTSTEIGTRLKQARGARSRNALGKESGISGQSIANIEEKGRMPTVATAEQLAGALGVSVCWLAYGETGEGEGG